MSKSPEDSRLSEHHPSFLELVGDFTDTSFRVSFHSFFDLSVVNYYCFLSWSGSCCLLVSLVVSKLLISPCPLFLLELQLTSFSFSIQIACFSLKVSFLIFILVCVCHHRMQDSECRSKGYNWYDTFPAFNIWRMNATGHSWSLRNTCEATVPILMLTSDKNFLAGKTFVLNHPLIKCDIL